MADACPGASYRRLAWASDWYIRDETYSKALSDIVNFQHQLPHSSHWGSGTTSSSDGQAYRFGSQADTGAQVNAKYGSDPTVMFYTHVSDQYAPFYSKVINSTVPDATHILDGLLYHATDLKIEEHYTDTAGYTDHVFALCGLLGFKFAPRIRGIGKKALYSIEKPRNYPVLAPLMAKQVINLKQIESYWDDILRLAASVKTGTVTASLILRKLASYPKQNGLALALRELGRIDATLFELEWLQDPHFRRRIQIGLNKGEALNKLKRAVLFHRRGEILDTGYEDQSYRASGLNLITAAIVLWNTVYLSKVVEGLEAQGVELPREYLKHVSPLGWDHITLTGESTGT
jgi:TnpA family transposase